MNFLKFRRRTDVPVPPLTPDNEVLDYLVELAMRPQSVVTSELLSGMTDYVIHLQRVGYSIGQIREKAEWYIAEDVKRRGVVMADDKQEQPAATPKAEDFVTVACDTGAHERCRLSARDMRPCQCWCHKKETR